jgi:hypothetical protein
MNARAHPAQVEGIPKGLRSGEEDNLLVIALVQENGEHGGFAPCLSPIRLGRSRLQLGYDFRLRVYAKGALQEHVLGNVP